jgi:hypothetical protein
MGSGGETRVILLEAADRRLLKLEAPGAEDGLVRGKQEGLVAQADRVKSTALLVEVASPVRVETMAAAG